MCPPPQKKCQPECDDDTVGVGVGVAPIYSELSGDGFCRQQASTTDPVIKSTTLRDFFTRVGVGGSLAHRCCDDVANTKYDRSTQDPHGDILVLAHLFFEIERCYQIKQFEPTDR
jgi:hypothetical protein